jgi:uncharacterized membrane protein YdjX (TVP38/TMEM64 family)
VRQPSRPGPYWRRALLVVTVLLLVLGGRSLASHLEAFSASLRALGAWGAVLFIGIFALASAAFVPAGLLTMTSGALFGIMAGIAYAFIGACLGACLAFLVARYAARGLVERWLARHPRAALLGTSVGEHGRRIVVLLRLSPVIPFSVINVTMGVTRIRLIDFVVANFGMLPVTALYVYYGAAAGALVTARGARHPHGTAYWVLMAIGLAATLAVTMIVARLARQALARETGLME